ncbi:MAG: fibronectin type III domain-containing protein [Gemmatimonadota bacterium]
MTLRLTIAFTLLSTLGFSPAALEGQSLEGPRSFRAHASGGDVVLHWSGEREHDLYIGEIDDDPGFDSPRRWAVNADGRGTYEHVLHDVGSGVWFLRVRAVESFVAIRRQSDWSHVERVVVDRDGRSPGGRDGDGYDDGDVSRGPRDLDATVTGGDDVRVSWSQPRRADRYLLQLADDARFRDPHVFTVAARDGGVQRFTLRNVPDGRWFLRVRAIDSSISRVGLGWSRVAVVDVGRSRDGGRVHRDDADFGDGSGGDLSVRRRGHPVFEEHPGRGRGKGHLKQGRRPGVDDDRDEREDDD